MAINHIIIGDLGQDAWGKCNDLMDVTQVSGNIITGNILEITRFDASTYQIQLPYSQDQINVGLVTTILGAGPYTTSTTSGSYQVAGVIYSIGVVTNFPIPAAPIIPDNRIDLIYGDNTSTLFYVTGTPSPVATPPSLPANSVAIAYIFVGNTGTPILYDADNTAVTNGTVINSTLRWNGSAQLENTKLRHTTTNLINEDSDINSTWDNAINAYSIIGTKTLTVIDQFRYSDNNTSGLLLQNCEFNLSSIENGVDRLSEIKTFGTSGILTIRNEDTITTNESFIQLNGTTQTLDIGIGGGTQSQYNELYRLDLNGLRVQTNLISGAYNALVSDYILLADTSGGAVSVVLPIASDGQIIVVKDYTGNALTNNIVVTASGGLNIDNGLQKRIQYAYGGMTFVKRGTKQVVTQGYNQSSQATTGSYALLCVQNNVNNTACVLANTFYKSNFAAITSTQLANQTSDGTGRLTYGPSVGRQFEFTLSFSLSVSANNRLAGASIYKNGGLLAGTIQESYMGVATRPNNMTITQIDNVANTDYYELQVRNATAAGENINVKHLQFKVVELQRT